MLEVFESFLLKPSLWFQLEKPFNFTASRGYVGAVCLPVSGEEVQGNVTVSGWGAKLIIIVLIIIQLIIYYLYKCISILFTSLTTSVGICDVTATLSETFRAFYAIPLTCEAISSRKNHRVCVR